VAVNADIHDASTHDGSFGCRDRLGLGRSPRAGKDIIDVVAPCFGIKFLAMLLGGSPKKLQDVSHRTHLPSFVFV